MSISIEKKVVEMANLQNDIWLRKSICKFLERISLDEKYINLVLKTNNNRKRIDLANIFKTIRNGR